MIDALEERRDRHWRRSRLYRVGFTIAAFLLLAVGIVLSLPLVPGPGLPLIAIALAMLALEFYWAERLLHRIAVRVDQVEERIGWGGIAAIAAVAIAAAVAVLFFDVPGLPF
jgi:uncharacterized protein (TIGR02611 family)